MIIVDYLINRIFFIHIPVDFSLREIVILFFTQRACFVTLHISAIARNVNMNEASKSCFEHLYFAAVSN